MAALLSAAAAAANATTNVTVAVRLRHDGSAANGDGDDDAAGPVWRVRKQGALAYSGPRLTLEDKETPIKRFSLDHTFDADADNVQVFQTVLQPIIDKCCAGYHGALITYGASGTGKTNTVMGLPTNPGLIPLCLMYVFKRVRTTPGRKFLLRMSYLEIYKEVTNDLLSPASTHLHIRRDSVEGSVVENATEIVVQSADIALQLIAKGESQRHVGRSDVGEATRRSHTILRLVVESTSIDGSNSAGATSTRSRDATSVAVLYVCDLAGAEHYGNGVVEPRRKSVGSASATRDSLGSVLDTGDSPAKPAGAVAVDKSLVVLHNVVAALGEAAKRPRGSPRVARSGAIPYRDSKLTRVLQEALGGKCFTTLLCTIATSPACAIASAKTLQFATRARAIVNQAVINRVTNDRPLIRRYEKELQTLTARLNKKASSRDGSKQEDMRRAVEARVVMLSNAFLQPKSKGATLSSSSARDRRSAAANEMGATLKPSRHMRSALAFLERTRSMAVLPLITEAPAKPSVDTSGGAGGGAGAGAGLGAGALAPPKPLSTQATTPRRRASVDSARSTREANRLRDQVKELRKRYEAMSIKHDKATKDRDAAREEARALKLQATAAESNHSSALFQEHEHVAQAMVQRDRAVEDLQHLLHALGATSTAQALEQLRESGSGVATSAQVEELQGQLETAQDVSERRAKDLREAVARRDELEAAVKQLRTSAAAAAEKHRDELAEREVVWRERDEAVRAMWLDGQHAVRDKEAKVASLTSERDLIAAKAVELTEQLKQEATQAKRYKEDADKLRRFNVYLSDMVDTPGASGATQHRTASGTTAALRARLADANRAQTHLADEIEALKDRLADEDATRAQLQAEVSRLRHENRLRGRTNSSGEPSMNVPEEYHQLRRHLSSIRQSTALNSERAASVRRELEAAHGGKLATRDSVAQLERASKAVLSITDGVLSALVALLGASERVTTLQGAVRDRLRELKRDITGKEGRGPRSAMANGNNNKKSRQPASSPHAVAMDTLAAAIGNGQNSPATGAGAARSPAPAPAPGPPVPVTARRSRVSSVPSPPSSTASGAAVAARRRSRQRQQLARSAGPLPAALQRPVQASDSDSDADPSPSHHHSNSGRPRRRRPPASARSQPPPQTVVPPIVASTSTSSHNSGSAYSSSPFSSHSVARQQQQQQQAPAWPTSAAKS